MFVDDMGILIWETQQSFQEVENSISLYESMSQAKLNIHKSAIIPLGPNNIPQWLVDKGCIILGFNITKVGEITRYLGAPLGINISQVNIQNIVGIELENALKFGVVRGSLL